MISSLKSLINELGITNTISYLFSRVFNSVFGIEMTHYIFYSQPISSKKRVSEKKLAQYEFQVCDQNSQIISQLDRPLEVIETRFKQGAICLLAKKEDLLLGCIWLVKQRYIEDQIRASYYFPDDTIWDFDVFVIPKKRLTPLFAALWDTADNLMLEQNINKSISRILAYNSSSIKSHTSAGASKIGWLIALSRNNFQITFHSLAPFIHIATSKQNSGPHLRFKKF